jgi:uncharacterized membrane protein
MNIFSLKPWELHPALVHFPIALLLSAVMLDLFAWWRGRNELNTVVTGLLIAGAVSGVLAGLAGLLAYYTVPAHTVAAHGQMYWHLGLQLAALGLFVVVILIRRRSVQASNLSRGIGLLGTALLVWGSALGGEIVYRGAAGIDPSLLSHEVLEGHSHGGHEHDPDSKPATNAEDNGVRQP